MVSGATVTRRGELTWQSLFWRIVVTVLLLIALMGSGLTTFHSITHQPDSHVLPALEIRTADK